MGLYDMTAIDMAGKDVRLSEYDGKLLLIVNTASKCGYTPQFKGLQALYEQYKDKGLEILGFPCNQFKSQDPGTNEEIESFCRVNYGVTFRMFRKIEVNGENRHPLYAYLIDNAPEKAGEDIDWNFEKFLIDRQGGIVHRYGRKTTPKAIGRVIGDMI